MPDIALITFLLTSRSRTRAREAGKINADATTGPDGYARWLQTDARRGTMNWVGNSLDGYYTAVRRAIYLSMLLRAVDAGWMIRWLFKRLRTLKVRRV